MKHYLSYRAGHISPAWYTLNMGIGISSCILYKFPYPSEAFELIAICLWLFNIIAFVVISVLLVGRCLIYPRTLPRILTNQNQSLFLSCMPMGFGTINTMIVFLYSITDNIWKLCYTLFWIQAMLSLLSAWGLFFVILSFQRRQMYEIDARLLLPIVSVIVCSAVGATITSIIPIHLQSTLLTVCFMMWANGEALAFVILTIYVARMLQTNLVRRKLVFTTLLPLGPLGQGAYSIMLMGESFDRIYGTSLTILCDIIALLFLSNAAFWMALSIMSAVQKPPPKFSLTWWALTFPLGTVVTALAKLSAHFESDEIRRVAAFFGIVEVSFALVCLVRSMYHGFYLDDIFDDSKKEMDEDMGEITLQ